MTHTPQLDFDGADLALLVEQLPRDVLHDAPFGAIRLDEQGKVVFFNRTEAHHSGFGDRPVLGRGFFTEIAPCMSRSGLVERMERARERGTLDITLDHVGDFDDATRSLRVRIQSLRGGAVWVFIERQ